jgi:hypothetical protein
MKFNVTFRCALQIDLDKHPAGEELAEHLAAKFREHGLGIEVIDNYDDFAWWLEFKGRSSSPWLLVGYVGDGVYEWLVQINSGVSWLGRHFGRSDQTLREEVARKLQEVIGADANFSEIRWHQGDFSDDGWSTSP